MAYQPSRAAVPDVYVALPRVAGGVVQHEEGAIAGRVMTRPSYGPPMRVMSLSCEPSRNSSSSPVIRTRVKGGVATTGRASSPGGAEGPRKREGHRPPTAGPSPIGGL